jgi:hypothetical protein
MLARMGAISELQTRPPRTAEAVHTASRVRLGGQILPSQTKQNQTRMLGFAWFYSSESGLFSGLRREKLNKFALFLLAAERLAGRGLDT